MMLPLIGELNRRATFTLKKHVPDAKTGFKESEVSTFSVWAKLEVIGASQFWGTTQINKATSHRIWVRRIDGKTRPEDLTRVADVEIDGSKFRIRRVTDSNDDRRFTCIESELLEVK